MRNYLDNKSDGVASKSLFAMTDNNKTFIYTLVLTILASVVMAFVDYFISKPQDWGDVLIIIYKTLLPTIITFVATIILKNLVATRKGKYLHGNIIGLIVVMLVPVLYVTTLLIESHVLIIITGLLSIFATIVSVWAHMESPTE